MAQQTFDTPGTFTWTCPAVGVSQVDTLRQWDSGAGGGDTDAGQDSAGAGGGGGAYAEGSAIPVTGSTGYSVVVPAGGAAGSASAGSNGMQASFNGVSYTSSAATGGGVGAPFGGSTGGTGGVGLHNGGNGGDGPAGGGGGGGGGGGQSNPGSVGGSNPSVVGGTGGGGGDGTNNGGNGGTALGGANATPGVAPSGGGGGGAPFDGTPPGAGGAAKVVVEWSYQPPAPTTCTPNQGFTAGGASVTISDSGGASFSSGCTVTFGGVPATSVVVVDVDTITCMTPAFGGGTPVNVVVTNADGTSGTITSGFTYFAPAPLYCTPSGGTTAGGGTTSIVGTAFSPGCTVTVGGVPATVTFLSSTDISCTTGAHAAGLADVVVTDTNGVSGTKANAFTYFSSGGGGVSGSRIFGGF